MPFPDYLSRGRSGASSYLTPSPSSRSNGLPSLASISISSSSSSSTPQLIQTPQSVNGELQIVTLPSCSELIARLGNIDMDHTLERFKAFKPPPLASVDPRLTPPHCASSFSYPPPRHHPHFGLLSATHHHHHHPCCQPHYHTSALFYDVSYDFNPDSIRLRAVSPTHTHTYECQHSRPHTHTQERPWSPASSITGTIPSPSNPSYEYEPAGQERVYELESGGKTVAKPKLRRVRREQPMSKSRQAFQAKPRTTIKPARSKFALAKSSSGRASKGIRLQAHPMPFFATLFPKGIRNYTGVPHDEQDDRENYFSDEQLIEMMPSGNQRWQDAVNQYKSPLLEGHEMVDAVKKVDDTQGLHDTNAAHDAIGARCIKERKELYEAFMIKLDKPDARGATVWQCKGFFKADGKTPCRHRQTRQALKRHINDTHFGFRPWPCPFSNCDKFFKQRTSMNIHAYSVHTGQTPFPCKHCPKQFSDPAQRHDHCKSDHKHIPMMTRKKKAHSSDEDEETEDRGSQACTSTPIDETMNANIDVNEGDYSDDY